MPTDCQHIIEPGHMGANCKLCGWSEIAEWYGMYDVPNNEKQLNGEQQPEHDTL